MKVGQGRRAIQPSMRCVDFLLASFTALGENDCASHGWYCCVCSNDSRACQLRTTGGVHLDKNNYHSAESTPAGVGPIDIVTATIRQAHPARGPSPASMEIESVFMHQRMPPRQPAASGVRVVRSLHSRQLVARGLILPMLLVCRHPPAILPAQISRVILLAQAAALAAAGQHHQRREIIHFRHPLWTRRTYLVKYTLG